MTTFGSLSFPLAAYRVRQGNGFPTCVPARKVFIVCPNSRSSPLCLEWESRLGSMHSFRTAESELAFFSHGAIQREDTTIAAHTVAAGSKVPQLLLYRTPETIRSILEQRATRDPKTGKPIVYGSSDAYSQRRYVDETWDAQWKNANGVRIWCVDRRTGDIIHLGGQYTWGDCHVVGAIIDELIAAKILPVDGDYGQGVVAQMVWVTDGMPWFEEHILKKFPSAIIVLDVFHLFGHIATFAAAAYGKGTAAARRFREQAYEATTGAPKEPKTKHKVRRGHSKGWRAEFLACMRLSTMRQRRQSTTNAEALLRLVEGLELASEFEEARADLVGYIKNNAYRMDYGMYLQHGYQIGSGAMEAFHPVAGQQRMKRSGPGWRPEAAQAIWNLRLLRLVDRWHEFWGQFAVEETPQTMSEAA